MNNSRPSQLETSGGMTVGDIYYVVFRHKWKIIILSVAGFLAATFLYYFKPPPFQSQAELLIQYVPQAGTMPVMGSDQKVVVPDSRGADIINSEIQIMTSLDLAGQAVSNIGPASILAKVGGGNDAGQAAGLVWNNFLAEPAGKSGGGGGSSSIIVVTFKHPDPAVVQPVLRELINDYLQKQKEIHSGEGQFEDALSREVSTLSVQLNDTEQQIATLKNKANITSLDDSRKDLGDQISKIQGAILDAQAELAGYQAAMKQSGGIVPTDQQNNTNAAPAASPAQFEAYNTISANLEALRKKQQDYLLQGFTKNNSLVKEVDGQIAEAQKSRDDLQKNFPQIADLGATAKISNPQFATSVVDLRAQAAQVATLQAKLTAWTAQLVQVKMQATNLNSLAPAIAQLEETRAIQAANYQNLSTSIEKSHIDQAVDTGNAPNNIKWVQYPSPPFRNWKKTQKLMAMLGFGGIAAGLGWAFLIEFVLDRSVRRPVEIVSKLKLHLFLSIPDVSRNRHAHIASTAQRSRLAIKNGDKITESPAPAGEDTLDHLKNGDLPVVSLEQNPALYPFCEALRDRLIVYFEVKNLTHKPKLVAVSSAGRGAGVSTIAAGLAASLSETGDGNVLLVDMNLEQGAEQRFFKGKASCGLDTALAPETKENALVQENLYVVNGNTHSTELPRILPKRFSALVPKLKASEYDYIIFDMPPVTQTSLTSRLARCMDIVLLVVEAEISDSEVVKQANTWLVESGATVGAVLNKTRHYVPNRLHQEFLNDK